MIIQIIQLSDTQVTCARFRQQGKNLTPLAGYRHAYRDNAELDTLLQEQLIPATDEIRTILSLPPSRFSWRELTLPKLDRKKLRAILPLELAGETANDEHELICDAIPLADGALLVGWMTVSALDELLQFLRGVGYDPEAVTCSSLGWHLVAPPEQQGPVALVDDNALMVCSQGQSLFYRPLPAGGNAIAQTLAALELGKDINVTTVYRLEGDLLDNELKLPLPAPLTGQSASGDLPADALISPLATATSYCGGEMFNLRSGPRAWTGKRSHLFRRFRVPLVLAGLLLLLLLSEASLRWYLLSRDITSLNSSIASIYKGIFPARKKVVDETAEVKAEIRRLQNNGATSEVLTFMQLLAQSKDDQTQSFSEVEYDGERFRLKGDARSASAVTALGQKLTAAGWMVDQPELTSRPDGMTLFLIKGRRGGTTP